MGIKNLSFWWLVIIPPFLLVLLAILFEWLSVLLGLQILILSLIVSSIVFLIWSYFKQQQLMKDEVQMIDSLKQLLTDQSVPLTIQSDEFKTLSRILQDTMHDVRDRMTFLRLYQERLESVFEVLVTGVLLVNQRGTITYMNPEAERILAHRKEKLIGESHLKIGSENGISHMIFQGLGNGKDRQRIQREIELSGTNAQILDVCVIPLMMAASSFQL